jgi:putative membrane protein
MPMPGQFGRMRGVDGGGDSRARDHLANERTYLAWLRTALSIVALGAVLARVTGIAGRVAAASVITVALGLVALVYGTARYYRVRADLEQNAFRPADRGPLVIAAVAVLAVAVVLPLLLL